MYKITLLHQVTPFCFVKNEFRSGMQYFGLCILERLHNESLNNISYTLKYFSIELVIDLKFLQIINVKTVDIEQFIPQSSLPIANFKMTFRSHFYKY